MNNNAYVVIYICLYKEAIMSYYGYIADGNTANLSSEILLGHLFK